MARLINKNPHHDFINGVGFTLSENKNFSVSEEISDEVAAQFLAVGGYELALERKIAADAVKPETKAQAAARKKLEEAAAVEKVAADAEAAKASEGQSTDTDESGEKADEVF